MAIPREDVSVVGKPEHDLWSLPNNANEAIKKWKIATRVIRMLIAIGIVTDEKVELAIRIACDLKD